jgi:glycosyltransferase involved in cell wall biosynthesis
MSLRSLGGDHLEWLRAFERRLGRPLRVLHVGNIANNAYLNAKFLRSVGIEAHVICYDYHHVMATPEWEEVELLHGHGDDFFPRFSTKDLCNYHRPDWFVSGTLASCAARMALLAGERPSRLRVAWLYLCEQIIALTTKMFGVRAGYGAQLLIFRPGFLYHKLSGYSRSRLARWIGWVFRGAASNQRDRHDIVHLVAAFDDAFPQRPDRLKAEDIIPFLSTATHFQAMFRHYDVVQCYATEPIHALLAGKHPYIAFEHGTLRHFTMADMSLHRLNALAYHEADHVLITNGDCLAYAQRLGIETYSPMIHPVDVDQHRQDYGDAVAELRKRFDADVVLFCPARQDWGIKGTDQFIRALPLIKRQVAGRVKLILIEWGQQIDDAKQLLDELGCAGDVIWKPSMCRIATIKHMRAADVVLDQMVLPVFGAIAPQAMAAGKPVIASYVPERTLWLIPEPAPILSAFCPEDIADAVVRALDPDWLADYERRARHWIDTYHHPGVVIAKHLQVYRNVLEGVEADHEARRHPSSNNGEFRGRRNL